MKSSNKTFNLRVSAKNDLISPDLLRKGLPMSQEAKDVVFNARFEIEQILLGKSFKKIVVLGPCSIHSEDQALKNGEIIRTLQPQVKDTMILVMRTYFEKPRTITGWKGLINDPFLNKSYNINQGLISARKILIDLNEMGVPCGMEILSQIAAERLAGLLSWICIGARTSECQNHREWASAFSTPVGFKNGTDGQIDCAIHAIKAAKEESTFVGNNKYGKSCIITSTGNDFCHIVLRGGGGSNYDPVTVKKIEKQLQNIGLDANIFIDCSHANSGHKHEFQKHVWKTCIEQIKEDNTSIKGLLLESSTTEGKQSFSYGTTKANELNSSQSITDECIGQAETEDLILSGHDQLSTLNKVKAA